ncbi:MAG TPA: 5'/3'-nucleotidase SurE [Bacteroidetes bacterium]|nr:5'/3'-nucleotidase SurE [Bacteroidota bacterium]
MAAENEKPFILMVNDDGIYAPGLAALVKEIKKIGEVMVVAPATEQSAVGHAITLLSPLRVWPANRNGDSIGYAVSGTPADCVKIAFWAILKKRKPALLISGINHGSNSGINVIYSGTASAATEGTILGIPSFAISAATYEEVDFSVAARFARRLAGKILKNGLPPATFLNVNVPPVAEEDLQGVEVTRQGMAVFREKFDIRTDPHKKTYYWLTGYKVNLDQEPDDADDVVILKNKISITPIRYDMTNYDFLDDLKTWDI